MAATCRTCGAPLPAFTFGAAKDQCETCRKIQETLATPTIQSRTAPDASTPPSYSSPQPALTPPPIWQSATFFLIAINVAVFLLMVLKNTNAFMQPTNQQLLAWGADFGPLTLDNQPWRAITAGFLHIGIIHIAVNMWSLWILGKIAERFVGPTSLVAIYLLTGVGASLASLAWDPVRVSAGASGPIFGFVGAMIGILYMAKDRLDPMKRKAMLNWVVRIAVINLFIGLTAGIDNMAHAGGLVTGALIGAALVITARNRTQDRGAVRRNIFIAAAAVLALLFFAARETKHDIVYAYQAETALDRQDYKTAIENLRKVLEHEPNDAYAHALLGSAYYFEKDYQNALAEDERSLAINPNQPEVRINMALVYRDHGQPAEAVKLFEENINKIKPDAESYKAFGEALLQNHEAERAENELRSAIKLDNKDPETHADLAKALREQGKTSEANIEDFAAAALKNKTPQPQVKP